jgi:Rap1a immunity proteins
MRRLFAGVVVAAVLMPACSSISAESVTMFQNGNQLYERCTEPNRDSCLGYVAGIFDALASGASIADYSACMPSGTTVQQAVDVATQFLTSHPEMRHYAAAGLVAQALSDAFPCSRDGNRM